MHSCPWQIWSAPSKDSQTSLDLKGWTISYNDSRSFTRENGIECNCIYMVIIHNSMIWDMVWSGVSWDMTPNHHSPALKETCFSMPCEIIISLSLNDVKVGHTLLLTRANATSASPLKRWGLVVYLNQKRANVRKKRKTTNLPHLELERHNDKDFAQKCRLLKQRLWVCFLQQNSSLLICIFFFQKSNLFFLISRKAIY